VTAWNVEQVEYLFRIRGLPFVVRRLRSRISKCKFVRPLGHQVEASMDFSLIVLGLVGLVFLLALAHVASKMASERESAGRRKDAARDTQKRIVPLTGDTVTHLGHS
jgi:hypothetical protein